MTPEKVQTIGRIITIGNSIGVILDAKVKDVLQLEKGDFVQLTVEKIERKES